MRRITGKHLLCLLLLAFPLSWAEDTKKDERKTENATGCKVQICDMVCSPTGHSRQKMGTLCSQRVGHGQRQYSVWSQAKNRRLFARQKISPPRQSVSAKHKSNLLTPARRCGRLMESCSSHMPCCDPCASCRCRLFNTICHCWRMNPLCLKRT